jgi:hypothetical protein
MKKIKRQNKTKTEKTARFRNHKKLALLLKVLELFLRCPILVLVYKQKF